MNGCLSNLWVLNGSPRSSSSTMLSCTASMTLFSTASLCTTAGSVGSNSSYLKWLRNLVLLLLYGFPCLHHQVHNLLLWSYLHIGCLISWISNCCMDVLCPASFQDLFKGLVYRDFQRLEFWSAATRSNTVGCAMLLHFFFNLVSDIYMCLETVKNEESPVIG